MIFRGDSGRELLGETLLKRGATVKYVECYRRVKPEADTAPLLRAAASGEMDAITITSSEGLRNLCEMVGEAGQPCLKRVSLFVSHERIAQTARTLGFTRVILTAAGDDGLLEGISNYFRPQATGKDSCFIPTMSAELQPAENTEPQDLRQEPSRRFNPIWIFAIIIIAVVAWQWYDTRNQITGFAT